MDPMTPEERFTKIENALNTTAGYLARQAETFARHDAENERQNAAIDKHNAAIRDLITVSRTVLDSQKETTTQIQTLASEIGKLRDAQQATDEKLHILIETVDRIIRDRKQ